MNIKGFLKDEEGRDGIRGIRGTATNRRSNAAASAS